MELVDMVEQLLAAAGLAFAAGFIAWRVLEDRRASRLAAIRPQPIRRPGAPERLLLPSADETRLSVARFRRVIGRWMLLEHQAEQLNRRAEALNRRFR